MTIHVDSETGRLDRVLLHLPGREIDWMVPAMMEQLLFDDILDGDAAREEHARFRGLLEHAGVEVLETQELLADVLAGGAARGELFDQIAAAGRLPERVVERLAELPADKLAAALVGGLHDPDSYGTGGHGRIFDLAPLPNYFFQRDPQVVLGQRVMISSMATSAREREPLIARLVFRHHPALAGAEALFDISPEHPTAWGPSAGWRAGGAVPTLEGGDVLVARHDTLLVGLSERTNRRGIERLAEYLRAEQTPFENLFLVELPPRRSYMHLDTVFTFIDRDLCLAYRPVIAGDGPEAAGVYQVDLTADRLRFTLRSSLTRALADLGIDVELVPCGGERDPIDQEREQWTDGANAFAVAPGVIFLYRRNRRTLEELDRRGFRVLGEEEVLAGGIDLLDGGRTVVTLVGNELARARGGPRCMTMPLTRQPQRS